MLQLEPMKRIAASGRNYSAWKDDQEFDLFYVLPDVPRLRVENGRPVFQFLRYRTPIVRGEGGEVAGLCVFDVDLAIPEADRPLIKAGLLAELKLDDERRARSLERLVLAYLREGDDPQAGWREDARMLRVTPAQVKGYAQQYQASTQTNNKWQLFLTALNDVKLGSISFTDGSISLNLEKFVPAAPAGNGASPPSASAAPRTQLVERVWSSGKPSLFGDNVATFTAELTKDGAGLFWDALRDGKGGIVSVVYNLACLAMLPPAEVTVCFLQREHKKFAQSRDSTIGTAWGQKQKEEIRQEYLSRGIAKVDVRPMAAYSKENAEEAAAVTERLREWGLQRLEDIIARQAKPEFDKVGSRFTTKTDSYFRGIDLSDTLTSDTDIVESYRELSVVQHHIYPNGTLAPITALKDANGNPLVPDTDEAKAGYFREVDLDYVFGQKLDVGFTINADFVKLGLFNVLVKVEYPGAKPETLSFIDNAAQRFKAFVSQDRSSGQVIRDFSYEYEINYRGKSRKYQSPKVTTNQTAVTIGIDDVGMFLVDGQASGINWTYVDRALVSIRYSDPAQGVSVSERQFTVDAAHTEFSIKEPIFVPRDKDYEYKVTYFMADGSEFTEDWHPYSSPRFNLQDPFVGKQEYSINAVGLFRDNDAIFLDMTYGEADTSYTQRRRVALTAKNPMVTWTVPAIDPKKSRLTYQGFMQLSNGNTVEIGSTVAASNLIRVGNVREDVLQLEISSEGLDFDKRVKLARVNLIYRDPAHDVLERKSFSFREETSEEWEVSLKDRTLRDYGWQAVIQLNETRFGDGGKVYLPGPTRNEWGTDDISPLMIADHMKSDAQLAQDANLLIVAVSTAGIDWGQLERIMLRIEYGKTKQAFRINEDNGEDQTFLFLAPRGTSDVYQWQVEFRGDDGERELYPADGWASSNDGELVLNDYVSTKRGGGKVEDGAVTISAEGIDWDQVEGAKLTLQFGKTRQVFRINEDNSGDGFVFSSPRSASDPYQWQVEFRMDDGEREVYPEQGWATASDGELVLNDFISESYSGALAKADKEA